MLVSAIKRQTLPFSAPKSREAQLEAATVFVMAEVNRSKGGGLLNRQPQETLRLITRVGYPLWVCSKNNAPPLIFDGLDVYSHNVIYDEEPSATSFMNALQNYQQPRENYVTFLCDQCTYFQQPPKTKQFVFRGLISETDFQADFSIYRREATEITLPQNLLPLILEEQTLNATFTDLDRLLAFFAEEKAKLLEIQKLLKKITSQYITEIEYEAAAAKEEADAKIKALSEFINPQVVKFRKEYNRRIKKLGASFDKDLDDLYKLKIRTEKMISKCESQFREYECNARTASRRGHEIYEQRWKDKAKQIQKVISEFRRELKNIENNVNRLRKQKGFDLSKLKQELDVEVKRLYQPIVDIEVAKDEKILAYKQESNRLIACEKPIAEGIARSLEIRETTSRVFDGLSVGEQKNVSLFYIPIYVVCFEANLSQRYILISPSSISNFDFSVKLRGVLGRSKVKDMLAPRFRAIAALTTKVEERIQHSSTFEVQLVSLGEKNNLLKSPTFVGSVLEGLEVLKQTEWVTEKEAKDFASQLTA